MEDRREDKGILFAWLMPLFKCSPCVSDSGCSSLTVLFEEGLIQSLHYPEDYSDMANCNWVFQAPKHCVIKVLTLVPLTLLLYLHRIANISTIRAEVFISSVHCCIPST